MHYEAILWLHKSLTRKMAKDIIPTNTWYSTRSCLSSLNQTAPHHMGHTGKYWWWWKNTRPQLALPIPPMLCPCRLLPWWLEWILVFSSEPTEPNPSSQHRPVCSGSMSDGIIRFRHELGGRCWLYFCWGRGVDNFCPLPALVLIKCWRIVLLKNAGQKGNRFHYLQLLEKIIR